MRTLRTMVMLALLFVGASAMAQDSKQPASPQLMELTKELSLSTVQYEKLSAMHETMFRDKQRLEMSIRDTEIRYKEEAKSEGAEKDRMEAKIKALNTKLEAMDQQYEQGVIDILTDEQKEKYVALKSKKAKMTRKSK